MIAAWLLAAQPAPAAPAPADVQIGARIEAREVRIEREGEARLTVRAEPDGGSVVDVKAPPAGPTRTLRNVVVTLDGQARIGTAETPATPPR